MSYNEPDRHSREGGSPVLLALDARLRGHDVVIIKGSA